jgi:hypothetical protein
MAPVFDAPYGLTPGHPDSRVRLVAETVDMEVLEHEGPFVIIHGSANQSGPQRGITVNVRATFDLHNEGPMISMNVGFPGWVGSMWNIGYGPVRSLPITDSRDYVGTHFRPSFLQDFRAWTDDGEFEADWRKLTIADGLPAEDWLVWNMTFPQDARVKVHVSFRYQVYPGEWGPIYGNLEGGWQWQSRFPVTYVLQTGALWHGTIGEATIRMHAPQGNLLGGADLLGAYPDSRDKPITTSSAWLHATVADLRAGNEVIWHLRDFEPVVDIRSDYMPQWHSQQLREAVELASREGASATDLAQAVEMALDLLPIVPAVLEWAEWAAAAEPENATAWLALARARLDASGADQPRGGPVCWAGNAANAYARAVELDPIESANRPVAEALAAHGAGIDAEIRDLQSKHAQGMPSRDLFDCSRRRAPGEDVVLADADQTYRLAVGPGGIPHNLAHRFDGELLARHRSEVEQLRARGAYRQVNLIDREAVDARMLDATTAQIVTREVWRDRTVERDGSVFREDSRRVERRYELKDREPGAWQRWGEVTRWRVSRLDESPAPTDAPISGPYGPLLPERRPVGWLRSVVSSDGRFEIAWHGQGFVIRRTADDTVLAEVPTPLGLVDLTRRSKEQPMPPWRYGAWDEGNPSHFWYDDPVFAQTADRIVTWSEADRQMRFWRTRDGELQATIPDGRSAVFAPDWSVVAVLDRDAVRIHRVPGGDLVRTARVPDRELEYAAFSPDARGLTLAFAPVASANPEVWRLGVDGGSRAPVVTMPPVLRGGQAIQSRLFSADGRHVVGRAQVGDAAQVWEVETGRLVVERAGIVDWAFSPSGNLVTLVTAAGTFTTYALPAGTIQWEVPTRGGQRLSFGRDRANPTLVAWGPGFLWLIRSLDGTVLARLADDPPIVAATITLDGVRLVVERAEIPGFTPSTYELWSMVDGRLLRTDRFRVGPAWR